MPVSPRLIAQNPWWSLGTAALSQDPKLRDLAGLPVTWEPPLDLIDLSQDGVYTLRGQRQVGKSTYLKLLLRKALSTGRNPRSVLYVDADAANARTHGQLVTLLTNYLDQAGGTSSANTSAIPVSAERILILLDEVTGIKNWQTAIRVLADQGRLHNVTLVATGSNCKDLKAGGDRLPRRRGRILDRDLVMQPLSFRDYLQVTDPSLAAKIPLLQISDCYDPHRVYEAAQEVHLMGATLLTRFDHYLTTGGFLVSITEAMTNGGQIPEHVYLDYQHAILGEVIRMGRREETLRPVVYWLRNKLGEEFDWRELARDTHIAAHDTVRDLVEDLQAGYVWHIYYRVKEADGCFPALKSPKRLYPIDPFTWHTLSAWSQGAESAWAETLATMSNPTLMGKLTESVVADHIRRLSGTQSHYYRTNDGEEIDFVTCRGGTAHGKIEVKYRSTIQGRDQGPLRRNGGGLLLSKETIHFTEATTDAPAKGPVAELPIPYALALWPAKSVYPVRGV